jgi:rRNA maturation RNase YbeY
MPARIYFFKSNIKFRFSNKRASIKWIETIIKKNGQRAGEINFIFCSDLFLLEINRQYLKHDYFTDIITFDYSAWKIVNGEIYISIDRVRQNADSLKVKFQDELRRVIIHGVLHLLGFLDHTKPQKKQMRKKEDACLSLFHSST